MTTRKRRWLRYSTGRRCGHDQQERTAPDRAVRRRLEAADAGTLRRMRTAASVGRGSGAEVPRRCYRARHRARQAPWTPCPLVGAQEVQEVGAVMKRQRIDEM